MDASRIFRLENEIHKLEDDLEQKRLELSRLKSGGGEGHALLPSREALNLPVAIVVAGLVVAVAIFFSKTGRFSLSDKKETAPPTAPAAQQDAKDQGAKQPTAGPVPVSPEDDPFLGSKNAKVTIIEFSDYQCPYCQRFWKDTLPQLKQEYLEAGKSVKLVFRDYPLPFHNMAQKYAEATECASEQGKFWDMHDKIFSEQGKESGETQTLDVGSIKQWAGELKLNTSKFNQCLDSGKYAEEVKKDAADGSAAGVTGTPSFFINSRLLVGAQPFQSFKSLIDEELAK